MASPQLLPVHARVDAYAVCRVTSPIVADFCNVDCALANACAIPASALFVAARLRIAAAAMNATSALRTAAAIAEQAKTWVPRPRLPIINYPVRTVINRGLITRAIYLLSEIT